MDCVFARITYVLAMAGLLLMTSCSSEIPDAAGDDQRPIPLPPGEYKTAEVIRTHVYPSHPRTYLEVAYPREIRQIESAYPFLLQKKDFSIQNHSLDVALAKLESVYGGNIFYRKVRSGFQNIESLNLKNVRGSTALFLLVHDSEGEVDIDEDGTLVVTPKVGPAIRAAYPFLLQKKDFSIQNQSLDAALAKLESVYGGKISYRKVGFGFGNIQAFSLTGVDGATVIGFLAAFSGSEVYVDEDGTLVFTGLSFIDWVKELVGRALPPPKAQIDP